MTIELDVRTDTPEFTVTVATRDEVHEVTVSGELDVSSASLLREELLKLGPKPVVVDVSNLEFIDAAGLSALVLAAWRDDLPRGQFIVRGAHGLVRRVIVAGELEGLLDRVA